MTVLSLESKRDTHTHKINTPRVSPQPIGIKFLTLSFTFECGLKITPGSSSVCQLNLEYPKTRNSLTLNLVIDETHNTSFEVQWDHHN